MGWGDSTESAPSVAKSRGSSPSARWPWHGRQPQRAITLSRGVTHDTAFEQWANKSWTLGSPLGPGADRGVCAAIDAMEDLRARESALSVGAR